MLRREFLSLAGLALVPFKRLWAAVANKPKPVKIPHVVFMLTAEGLWQTDVHGRFQLITHRVNPGFVDDFVGCHVEGNLLVADSESSHG